MDLINICAKRMRVPKLCEYLRLYSNPKPYLLLCSKQCGLLIEAMQSVALWLAQWEKTTLPASFVQDLLTLATKGVRLLEECKHVKPSTWLVVAASKMERREQFLELFEGFLQDLNGYVEVMQGPLSHFNTHDYGPPSPSSLQSVSSAGSNETCLRDAASLIAELKKHLRFLPLKAAEDRRVLFESLEQSSFTGEESRFAQLLMEHLEDKQKQTNPLQLDSLGIVSRKPKLLGKGTFGEVYEATWMGLMVAVKQFRAQASLDGELKALLTTSHVNVMRAIAFCPEVGSRKSCLLMERMKGDLGQFVSKLKTEKLELPLSVSIEILLQIATGMAHLHGNNVMHRDLKPENILFSRWPPMSKQDLHVGPGDFTAKITDFGESRTQAHDTTHATAKRGTACYRAPEILHAVDDDGRARYSNKVDVYSFGMVCYKLLTRLDPCLSGEKALQGDCSELRFPSSCPRAFIFLMRRCWMRAHQKRPSFAEICDFLALFKSIVLNTTPTKGGTPPLYLGIRDDLLEKLVAFLGKEWLMDEAISLGIRLEFVEGINRIEIDEMWLRLQVTSKLAAFPEGDYLRCMRCCMGPPILLS